MIEKNTETAVIEQ